MRIAEHWWCGLLGIAAVVAAVPLLTRSGEPAPARECPVEAHALPWSPTDFTITLAHNGVTLGASRYPVYSITIQGNGNFTWVGQSEVWELGEKRGTIARLDAARLLADLAAMRFAERDDQGEIIPPDGGGRGMICSDAPSTTISLRRGMDTHTVLDRCEHVEMFTQLEDRIAALTGLDALVDGPTVRREHLADHLAGRARGSLGDAFAGFTLGMPFEKLHGWLDLADVADPQGTRVSAELRSTSDRLDSIRVPLGRCPDLASALERDWGPAIHLGELREWISPDGRARVTLGEIPRCTLTFERTLDVETFAARARAIAGTVGGPVATLLAVAEPGTSIASGRASWQFPGVGSGSDATEVTATVIDGKVTCVAISADASEATIDAIGRAIARRAIPLRFVPGGHYTLQRGDCDP